MRAWFAAAAACEALWPCAARAAGDAETTGAALAGAAAVLWALSGAALALTARDKLRADRFCPWILLQAVCALLAAILSIDIGRGAWATAARLALFLTCASALAGAGLHVDALRVQSRLRRARGFVQTVEELEAVDRRLAKLTEGASERFLVAYQAEADDVEKLRALGWAGLRKPAAVDADRSSRMAMQARYLDYKEQVIFKKAARLLRRKEELLVHIAPYLKRRYLLDAWCDVQVSLFGFTTGLALVYALAHWCY